MPPKPTHPKAELRALIGGCRLSTTATAVLAVLWTFTDAEGCAYPSSATIARILGLKTPKSVYAGVKELERSGLLTVERSMSRDTVTAHRAVNRYRLHLPAATVPARSSPGNPLALQAPPKPVAVNPRRKRGKP